MSEVAKAAARSKGTYLSAQYHRIRGRRGPGKATMAVAHSVPVIAYHVLDQSVAYCDLGEDYLQQRRSAEHDQGQLVGNSNGSATRSPWSPSRRPDPATRRGAHPQGIFDSISILNAGKVSWIASHRRA